MKIKSFFKNIYEKVRLFTHAFFYGMRKTEDDFLTQKGGTVGDSGIHKEVHENRVSKALLKGEITQEVVDLRYRTYVIERASKGYEYFSPFLTQKKTEKTIDDLHCDLSDGMEPVLVQPNHALSESVSDALERLDSNDRKQVQYYINVDRMYTPRYRIEEYTKRLVVKKGVDDNHATLDFYVSKYIDRDDFKSAAFVHEVERIKDKGQRSDITRFGGVSFMTSHAWNCPDMYSFSFVECEFVECLEFDGSYILRFSARIKDGGTDQTEQYYSERMAKKYRDHEKREMSCEFGVRDGELTEIVPTRTYVCECCGKEIVYDAEKMAEADVTVPDEDGNYENENLGLAEYSDAEIAEMTFGKVLCKECMEKQIAELMEKKAEEINEEEAK